ncbi:MAG: hypothetical protein AABX90_02830, partial [Nanoarchaeota archaeon]
GVCNFPGPEACLNNYCSDCIGSQADCPDGKICAQDIADPTKGICISGAPVCGDGTCSNEPYGENCFNCRSPEDGGTQECFNPAIEVCCEDATTGTWYTAPISQGCGIPPTVTSCPDWCVYISNRDGLIYNNGACAQNPTQCARLPGPGTWLRIDEADIDGNSGNLPACDVGGVDNECDGDEFCFAGSIADHCCCIVYGG